jgi:hypothetical protein
MLFFLDNPANEVSFFAIHVDREEEVVCVCRDQEKKVPDEFRK